MSIITFQSNLTSLKNFSNRLKQEDMPIQVKKCIMKTYANQLNFNLTDQMIEEVINNLG